MKQYSLFPEDDWKVEVPEKKPAPRKFYEHEPQDLPEPVVFMSFGSGSSGNSSYLGTRERGLLIDAGVEGAHIENSLRANGISMDAVEGILVTHDHSDHVRYLYNVVRYHPHIGIYCTPRVLDGMLRRHSISRRIKDYHHPIHKEFPFELAGMKVTAFDMMHDGSDNMGFHITTPAGEFAIATDLGCVNDRTRFYMSRASYVVIEANYDAAMLKQGRYPEYLKARIRAERGHMDNAETGLFLHQIYHPELSNVFLCHLSHDNNTPEIALKVVKDALEDAGVADFSDGLPSLTDPLQPLHLVALPRYVVNGKGREKKYSGASPLYILRPRAVGSEPEGAL